MKPIGKNKKERGRKRGRVIVPSQRLKMCTPHKKKKERIREKMYVQRYVAVYKREKKKKGGFRKVVENRKK